MGEEGEEVEEEKIADESGEGDGGGGEEKAMAVVTGDAVRKNGRWGPVANFNFFRSGFNLNTADF